MSRCEDFPCCGHEMNGCPDDEGRFPCASCHTPLPVGAGSSLCADCQAQMFAPNYVEWFVCTNCGKDFNTRNQWERRDRSGECPCDEIEADGEYYDDPDWD